MIKKSIAWAKEINNEKQKINDKQIELNNTLYLFNNPKKDTDREKLKLNISELKSVIEHKKKWLELQKVRINEFDEFTHSLRSREPKKVYTKTFVTPPKSISIDITW